MLTTTDWHSTALLLLLLLMQDHFMDWIALCSLIIGLHYVLNCIRAAYLPFAAVEEICRALGKHEIYDI